MAIAPLDQRLGFIYFTLSVKLLNEKKSETKAIHSTFAIIIVSV